ncbi:P-loop containing nucleoside triphosphate hydrolase protein [Dactylonectria macrodidyma]|uniref:P-loop containing nucleoside triphosphate hydrolase protein n=1 Tax=Dactylonectria macrodidyma TaxID=307937 RepID=A0A9P9J0L8_9HYPO|nr:P-loop containing nucleoside triphosphate hydrolase protein [Dactylonectria macrodidyma]
MTTNHQSSNRDFSGNQLGDNATIIQGDTHLHLPHLPAHLPVRAIPYPRNEDLVSRPDLVARINELLPRARESYSAALWGLGGSGKTQLAIDYAYRRCEDRDCSVFWVHADNKASFSQDYKTIARKLGLDKTLEDEALFVAVRESIESQPLWVLILDNADDLTLFGVGTTGDTNSLFEYIPKSPAGMTLWTSRDEHIVGTLVGPRRGVEVGRMTLGEATELLNIARKVESSDDTAAVAALLEELQLLPLAVSQAGAYVQRTSTSVNEYLSMLSIGKHRWEILKEAEVDRHRRPDATNSVLETWAISIAQIRQESKVAYLILHVIGYVDNRNITLELLRTARVHTSETGSEGVNDRELSRAITRLKQFSFISEEQAVNGKPSYEMHKLVQEAVRYGLNRRTLGEIGQKSHDNSCKEADAEAYFSGIAVQVIGELFPKPKRETWSKCETYLGHAVQVGEWVEVSGKKTETVTLLRLVAGFLRDRGRWREREPISTKLLDLQRETLGEKHPNTILSMDSLARTYRMQGRFRDAESVQVRVLDLQREVLGEKHPNAIKSLRILASIDRRQGRSSKAEAMLVEALELSRKTLGEKHTITADCLESLAATYSDQGRHREAEILKLEILSLRREAYGVKHIKTTTAMGLLAETYFRQRKYSQAESMQLEALDLRRELLGENHPDTITIMHSLAKTWHNLVAFTMPSYLWNNACSGDLPL